MLQYQQILANLYQSTEFESPQLVVVEEATCFLRVPPLRDTVGRISSSFLGVCRCFQSILLYSSDCQKIMSEIKFNSKKQGIFLLNKIFKAWNDLLSTFSEKEITRRIENSDRSIKDHISHLWVWQQISVARMNAALNNNEPKLDWLPERFNPECENDLEEINKWIYETNLEKSWLSVYNDWQEGFLQLIELAENISEDDFVNPRQYAWLNGHPLILVLEGSYNHHEEHIIKVLDFFNHYKIDPTIS